jgi:hypothetical protein
MSNVTFAVILLTATPFLFLGALYFGSLLAEWLFKR